MQFSPTKIIKLIVFCIVLALAYSCNKDSDLLADYVVNENGGAPGNFIGLENGTYITNEDKLIAINIMRVGKSGIIRKGTTVKKVTQPDNGKTEIKEDTLVVYIPNEDFNGDDSFTVTIEETKPDKTTVEQETDVKINVSPVLDAVEDTVQTSSDKKVVIDVLKNDTFTNKKNVTLSKTSAPSKGTIAINKDNTLTYTPNADASGKDIFTYTAQVVNTDKSISTDEGKVTVTILPVDKTTLLTGDNIYYVTTKGKSSNSGATEATAWSIQYAFKTAKAGDVVYIKAGNYGNEELNVKNSGTSEKSIKYIGYRNTPGDIQASNGSTFKYGDIIDANKMPLLRADRSGNKGQGIAITNWRSHIEFSNIQIQYYTIGVQNSGDYSSFENIVVKDVGDFSSSAYEGKGIVLKGKKNRLTNSIVINAGAEGINIKEGTEQFHSHNAVYSDNSTNPCDYYYLVNNSHNNTLDNIHVQRKNGLSHPGHGLVFKESATNNIATNVKVVNTNIEVSYSGVKNNTIENSEIRGSYDRAKSQRNNPSASHIQVSNGANNNTFKNIKVSYSARIVAFNDWNDGLGSPLDAEDAGNNNTFINIQGSDAFMGIQFSEFEKNKSSAHYNKFVDCSFKNIDRLFVVNRPNSGNSFKNCTFENIKEFQYTSQGYGYILNPNTSFSGSIFRNNNFKDPTK